MNNIVSADTIRGHQLTPTQAKAIRQHSDFMRKITEQAALLRSPRPPDIVAPPEPDPPIISGNYKLTWVSIVEVLPPLQQSRLKRIKEAVCSFYGVNYAELISDRRQKYIVLPRQIAAYLCKELTLSTLPAIGRAFGGRDHTTILHAHRKIERLLLVDSDLAFEVAGIRSRLEPLL